MRIFVWTFVAKAAFFFGFFMDVLAAQDEVVSLRSGEQAVISLDGERRTQINVFALSAKEQLAGIGWMMEAQAEAGFDDASVRGGAREVSVLDPNVLRITFLNLKAFTGDDERLLLVENGYDSTFRYHAVITLGSRSDQSSVCTVFPSSRGVEHWPFPIDRIDLGNLALEPYREGDAITCE